MIAATNSLGGAIPESLKQELGDKAYSNLIKRADSYFDTFKGLLNDMNESGIISKESRDSFF